MPPILLQLWGKTIFTLKNQKQKLLFLHVILICEFILLYLVPTLAWRSSLSNLGINSGFAPMEDDFGAHLKTHSDNTVTSREGLHGK